MDFGHRRCTSWILWSLNLDKLQNFILLLVLCRQLLVEEKEGLVGDIAFLQVKMGLLVVVFHVILQCTDMVAFKTGVIFFAFLFLPPLPVALLARFAFAFACLKKQQTAFSTGMLSIISLCRMLWQSVWIYAILLISRDLSQPAFLRLLRYL